MPIAVSSAPTPVGAARNAVPFDPQRREDSRDAAALRPCTQGAVGKSRARWLRTAFTMVVAGWATMGTIVTCSAEPLSASAILQELRSLRETATVLYVAAHPDDENTRLITWLTRGRGYRTGYLSITRGDGGQNLIGSELREALGVIRTQELLAARRLDGGEQFFTRAVDFGYSKTPDETLAFWDRQAVLLDVVRVIRQFRPDVIITRFSPQADGTHGHHTASAMLAVEAFTLAADARAFPAELKGLAPWQSRRVLWNVGRWGIRAGAPVAPGSIQLDVGGYNALLGESYSEIAARSRSMHKSQGFGAVGSRGPALEEFRPLVGEPVTTDLMDGIDSTWARVPGGADVGPLLDDAIAHFDALHPSRSVPALLAIRRRLAALPDEAIVLAKRRQLDRVLTACLGLHVETTLPSATVVPGEELVLKHTAILRAGDLPVRWEEVRYFLTGTTLKPDATLVLNQPDAHEGIITLPSATPLTQPYWLREPGTTGMFRVDDPTLIGRPENPPTFPIEHVFTINGDILVVRDAPVQVINDPVRGELRHPLAVVAPAALAFGDDLELFTPGSTRTVTVELTARRPGAAGHIALEAPAGWTVVPARQEFTLTAHTTRTRVVFSVTAPRIPQIAALHARAEVDGIPSAHRPIGIHYEHIPPQLLQPPAAARVVSVDVAVRARTIGYLPGAGDLVAEGLARLGCVVTTLTDADLTVERLRQFDAVVLGVRAFNTREGLAPQVPALFAYAEAGGTVIVQYNTNGDLKTPRIAPYPLKLSRDRVTDENSPVTFLAPDHPALTTPNRLTPADFKDWIQERGLYFPNEWDAKFTPLLAMNDPGEKSTSGALLVAAHGEGWYVYTGLSFFRELPEGVPGAYRLLANLVSLGR